ncbi:T-cell-interacting, activating receptor on myeloid cells protein 1 isoform X3 [Loxodonta africana]|uniref:T-cell-interacting, activating receptor on myeloid cells protein 1 isoform X3 n=1 Tax=Loxodonta africana TaxID=9785 RepID=UPI000C811F4E|nr:T-cell-interacting, activating receptor on myeloid cells protein 1 isoform X3 [Loxodonta africana]
MPALILRPKFLPFPSLSLYGLLEQGEWSNPALDSVSLPGPLPKPKLSAWPSSVVPPKSNVTLRCWTATRAVHFALKKGKTTLDFPYRVGLQSNPTESLAEFHLTELQTGGSGEYTCEYYRILSPYTASQPSDVLLLLVTGDLPKPSLRAYPTRNVAERKEVTLQCQKPGDVISYVTFALLKEGTPAPIQYWRPSGDTAEFSLKNVAVKDTGNYSCVYYQTRGPFWASHPSDSLEIWVTDGIQSKKTTPPETSKKIDETEGTRSPQTAGMELGTNGIILIVVFSLFFLLLLLLSAFFMYKYTRPGTSPTKTTKSFCLSSRSSKEPEEVVTDASVAMKSCSPVLADVSQDPNAEEPQGVTYAELDIRALRQGPSDLTRQPLETCVYSSVKT